MLVHYLFIYENKNFSFTILHQTFILRTTTVVGIKSFRELLIYLYNPDFLLLVEQRK